MTIIRNNPGRQSFLLAYCREHFHFRTRPDSNRRAHYYSVVAVEPRARVIPRSFSPKLSYQKAPPPSITYTHILIKTKLKRYEEN